jgi:predicted Zn-dependent peptidase
MTAVVHPRPAPADPRAWAFPAFERFRLRNGIDVMSCHLPDRRVVEARLVVPGASPRHESASSEGVALLTARAMSEGTERLAADEFNDAIESLGARFSAGLDWNAFLCGVSATAERLPQALELMTEAVTTPGFRDDDVARLVRRRLDEIKTMRAYPQSRANDAFSAAIFDSTSRMSHSVGGDETTVASLDAAAARGFWSAQAGAANATIVVVGDLRELDVAGVLERTIGAWQPSAGGDGDADGTDAAAGTAAVAAAERSEHVHDGGWSVVDFPEAVQTHLVVGHAGDPIPLDDRPGLRTAVHVLGGYFSSRLNARLREEKGITYGIGSQLDHRKMATVFRIDTSVQRDATEEAVVEILDAVRSLAGTLDPREVSGAIDHLVRTAPIGYKSTGRVADALVRIVTDGLPDDYFDWLRAHTRDVTLDEAAAAFTTWIRPDNLAVIAAGPAATIAVPLERLSGEG